tara:strand:+ start:2963 stop:3289 length:327 start_codon:yes stop_codon:yes gene_type:complete
MGRTKDLLGDLDLTEADILDELTSRNDDDYQYQKWMESKEFVEYVNGEIDSTKPRYSEFDIMSATRYASEYITIEPSEVGKKVYDMLFSEKIEEYLTCKTDVWTTKNT